jgi:hypothetical protein
VRQPIDIDGRLGSPAVDGEWTHTGALPMDDDEMDISTKNSFYG